MIELFEYVCITILILWPDVDSYFLKSMPNISAKQLARKVYVTAIVSLISSLINVLIAASCFKHIEHSSFGWTILYIIGTISFLFSATESFNHFKRRYHEASILNRKQDE